MRKPTLLLATVTTAFALGAAYSYREYRALAQNIAADKEQCTQQIVRLQDEYQAQMEPLQRQLIQGQ